MIKVEDVKKVLIIGSGTMGLRIGLQCAIKGFDVLLYDVSEESLAKAVKIQDKLLRSFIADGKITAQDAEKAKSKIVPLTDPVKAANGVDFVSESVLEEPEIKTKVYKQFSPLFPKHAVITTNTSYLLPSMFAGVSGNPSHFCAYHFHDVFYSNVVDIMPHPGTEEWIVDFLKDLGKKLDQIPILIEKESHGYIFNAILGVVLGASGALVTTRVASFQDVDRSWMGNTKMPMGPFGILDSIGLDTAWHITKSYKDEKSKRFAALLKSYMDAGKLGLKTGEGFYQYPNPAFKEKDFLK